MKKIIFLLSTIISLFTSNLFAQKNSGEKYGNTLNLGLGFNYYGSAPAFHANYEFDVAKSFTLAPFIGYYSYTFGYNGYYNNGNNYYKHYSYRETVIPIGLKGTYYFDEILGANSKWDFYLAGSLGFAIVNRSWDNDYYGDRDIDRRSNLYLDLHIGAEYHFNNRIGAFLDLSTGISSIGLAIHAK